MSKRSNIIRRAQADVLAARLAEPRRRIQVVSGPRQVGKTTMVQQVVESLTMPCRSVSADEPSLRDTSWIAQQWDAARFQVQSSAGAVLVLDEIQKITGWSETVKRLWDEDTKARRRLKVVILGSAPLLMAQGLTESLAGRFEVIALPHWSLTEMRMAFGFSLKDYIFFGGYPGSAEYVGDHHRWQSYVMNSLVETSIARDVLLMTRVDKPALLRRLFDLACRYSGQELSYTKMLGQLQDAGNTVTLAHYLDLLEKAGLVRSLHKYAGDVARQRSSSPKLQVLNTALTSASAGISMSDATFDPAYWGRMVESAIGSHLANAASMGTCSLFYWRNGRHEVDFVVQRGRKLTAIEVKSGIAPRPNQGMTQFQSSFSPHRSLLIGGDGITVEDFLSKPVEHWVA